MGTVSIFSLKSSPMNFVLPNKRRRALPLATSRSSLRLSRSSSCWGRQIMHDPVNAQCCRHHRLHWGRRLLRLWQNPLHFASCQVSHNRFFPSRTLSGSGRVRGCGSLQKRPACLRRGPSTDGAEQTTISANVDKNPMIVSWHSLSHGILSCMVSYPVLIQPGTDLWQTTKHPGTFLLLQNIKNSILYHQNDFVRTKWKEKEPRQFTPVRKRHMLAWASDRLGSEMAFSKMRLMAPLSLCSVSMVSSCTCFIGCWKLSGVSLLRMVRRRLNSRRVLICWRSLSSTSSSLPPPRVVFLNDGFHAFSALFSCTSSLREEVLLAFLASFFWACWERRKPACWKRATITVLWRYFLVYHYPFIVFSSVQQ